MSSAIINALLRSIKMSTFNIQINGLDEMKTAMKEAPDKVEPIIQRAVVTATDVLAKNTVRPNVPYRTGYLIQTFRRDVQRLMSRWFPTAAYAPFVEFGTPARVIVPINKKALFWPGASHPVKKVNHPGTKANPFMEAVRDQSIGEINQVFEQAGTAITKAISGK